jgi:hypothetical protein
MKRTFDAQTSEMNPYDLGSVADALREAEKPSTLSTWTAKNPQSPEKEREAVSIRPEKKGK